MAKLYFEHGVMSSAKSANLLITAFTYENQGKRTLSCKPCEDSRGQIGVISSRANLSDRACIMLRPEDDVFAIVNRDIETHGRLDIIFVDEAQFLKTHHVKELCRIADELDIPVICYGLKNSSNDCQLFEGSIALLYFADSIKEIKTTCRYCERKAISTLRFVNGKPAYNEEIISIGDTNRHNRIYFAPVCRKHYLNPPI